MSDRNIEKIFLYLLAVSLLLHVAIFAVVVSLPQEKKTVKPEPYIVELRDLPEVKPPAPDRENVDEMPKIGKKAQRPKEVMPKGKQEGERIASPVRPTIAKPTLRERGGYPKQQQTERGPMPATEAPQGENLFKPKQPKRKEQPSLAKLFPTHQKLAGLEEAYREKYKSLEQGDTQLIDSYDEVLGSFKRRFKMAVQDRWDALKYQAARDLGVAVLVITINHAGEVEEVNLLESTGNKALDDVAIKTVRTAGYVGPLPKAWTHEKLHLVYIYQIY